MFCYFQSQISSSFFKVWLYWVPIFEEPEKLESRFLAQIHLLPRYEKREGRKEKWAREVQTLATLTVQNNFTVRPKLFSLRLKTTSCLWWQQYVFIVLLHHHPQTFLFCMQRMACGAWTLRFAPTWSSGASSLHVLPCFTNIHWFVDDPPHFFLLSRTSSSWPEGFIMQHENVQRRSPLFYKKCFAMETCWTQSIH